MSAVDIPSLFRAARPDAEFMGSVVLKPDARFLVKYEAEWPERPVLLHVGLLSIFLTRIQAETLRRDLHHVLVESLIESSTPTPGSESA